MVAHAHIQLPIVLPFLLHGTGKLCSEFGKNRSISDVNLVHRRQTDGRLRDYILSNAKHCIGQTKILLHYADIVFWC